MPPTILVADDQASTRTHLASRLADAGFDVVEARDGLEAWDQFRKSEPDLVLTDLRMPRCDGLQLLERVRAESAVPVIILTSYGDVPTAVRAVKGGAEEFLSFDGLDVDELVKRIRRLVRSAGAGGLAEQLARRIPGRAPAIQRARKRIEGLLALRLPVLILGEPGTGRGYVARVMHELGPEPDGEFVHLMCTPDLAPPLRLPQRGTVYLEQMPLLSRANWSRWLELGGRATRGEPIARLLYCAAPSEQTEVRTNRVHPSSAVAQRSTRLRVMLPRLVDRLEDLPLLCDQLIERHSVNLGRPRIELEPGALEELQRHGWPGNLQELSDVLEQLVAFSPQLRVSAAAISEAMCETHAEVAGLREQRIHQQYEDLIQALHETGGNLTQAAERLGISRGALRHRARKFGLLPVRRGGR